MNFQEYGNLYHKELIDEIIPFWEKYSIDKENGGFFTCIDSNGTVYDTDKFVWLQGRQIWLFCMLYNQV